MDELTINNIRDLKRHLNSIEHMIYVSCKFTRTTEMLRRVMETMVSGYEQFFGVTYQIFVQEEDRPTTVHDKIQILKDGFLSRGISIDLSDYFLLKRLLLSEFECIGEYRKNLCMVSYIDGEEYIINIVKLLDFYTNLKNTINGLSNIQLA
jgi:hypothetical protein